MSINTKALVQTILIVTGLIGGSVLLSYLLSLIDTAAPAIFSCTMLVGVLGYGVYGLVKYRIESEEILNKLNSTK